MPNLPQLGWVALCLVPRINGPTLGALLQAFGSPRAIFEATEADLLSVPGIGPKAVAAIQEVDLETVAAQIQAWTAVGVELLTWQESTYPAPLLALRDRPPLLFARGAGLPDWRRVVAIVGTREPEGQAELMAEKMGYELARRGWIVVSGLALGIDAAAHRGAVQGGQTIAVLGCGVEAPFPMRHRKLSETILNRGGALYAEVPPGTAPSAGTLLARNRLIAGLARATIVIQSNKISGSLETARRARSYARPVLTLDVPHYEGNQHLLRMEALPLPPHITDWEAFAARLETLPEPPRQLSFFDLPDENLLE